MAKIAKSDADVMNSLYASEVTRIKQAGNFDTKEEGPTPSDAQAFKDHEEYLDLLNSVMKEDAKQGFDPNETKLD